MTLYLDFAREFYEKCCELSDPEAYNIILNKHLGDNIYILAATKEFEQVHNAPVKYLIRPNHEFLMKMYHIQNYSVIDMNSLIKNNNTPLRHNKDNIMQIKRKYEKIELNEIGWLEDRAFISIFSCIPQKGIPFICDSPFEDFIRYQFYWSRRWRQALELPIMKKVDMPYEYPELSEKAKENLNKIAPLDKIVLFTPTAMTAIMFPPEFWKLLIDVVKSKGYEVVINTENENYKFEGTYDAFDLGLSLEDVVALGIKCAYVFSMRSGMNDVLVQKGARMYTFYPQVMSREFQSLNRAFNIKEKVNEVLIKQFKTDFLYWEDIDISKIINKFLFKEKLNYVKALFMYYISFLSRNENIIEQKKQCVNSIKYRYNKDTWRKNKELSRIKLNSIRKMLCEERLEQYKTNKNEKS